MKAPKPGSTPKKPRGSFSIPEALERAEKIVAEPPEGWAPIVPGRGELVWRFVLPLDLCKTTNALISLASGGRKKARMSSAARLESFKTEVHRKMRLQYPENWRLMNGDQFVTLPLQGRAFIRAIRCSSSKPDQLADAGMKTAIDMLRVPRKGEFDERTGKIVGQLRGLGLIVDDGPDYVEIKNCWKQVPPKKGFGILELWSGDADLFAAPPTQPSQRSVELAKKKRRGPPRSGGHPLL